MSIRYKSASPKDLKAEWRRVSKATGSVAGYKKTKELDHLVGSLIDEESVVALSDGEVGNKGCLVVVTSDRLLLIRVGVLSGVDETEIGLSDILGVDIKSGLVLASITVKTHSENLQIRNLPKPAARFIAQKVREGKRLEGKSSESVASVSDNGIADRNPAKAPQEGGWVSGLVGLVLIGLLVWGTWSWVSGDDEASVAGSVAEQQSDQRTSSEEQGHQDAPRERDSKQKVGTSKKANRSQDPEGEGPFTVVFENYLEDGSGGGNLRVNNSSSTEYGACSIELGDSNQINRWYLPNKTVIDASGYRSYPTFLFQDRKGIAPPTLNSVKNGNINCKKPEISQNLNFTSNAANQKSQSENDGNGTQPKPKEAEQRDVAQHLEQLDREIASLPNVSATKYTGSVDEINVVLSLIGAWNLLYEQGAELDLDPEGQQKRQRFKALLIRKQVEMFPALRDAYGPAMRRQLWEADGSARTIGSGYRTVEFVSQGFAQNANIKQIHTELHENLLMLRFTRAQYKWFKQASEYSYYTLEPPKDSDLVKWEAGGRFRLLD